jgi:hypothetical protein
MPEEVREAYLEVRRRGTRELVTVIEVLSPTNKRPGSTGRAEYLAKRRTVLLSAAHLAEVDLLRGGERMPTAEPLPAADYSLLVSRALRRPMAEVWPFTRRDPIPSPWLAMTRMPCWTCRRSSRRSTTRRATTNRWTSRTEPCRRCGKPTWPGRSRCSPSTAHDPELAERGAAR